MTLLHLNIFAGLQKKPCYDRDNPTFHLFFGFNASAINPSTNQNWKLTVPFSDKHYQLANSRMPMNLLALLLMEIDLLTDQRFPSHSLRRHLPQGLSVESFHSDFHYYNNSKENLEGKPIVRNFLFFNRPAFIFF